MKFRIEKRKRGIVIKQNPCRYCALSREYKGKHLSGYDKQCRECEHRKKHEEYLKSQRKYEIGEKIETFQELMEQTFVFVGFSRKPMHIEAIKSWQVRIVLNCLERGSFYKAIKRESED